MNTLADKSIIVTGASSGIGRAAAKLFAEHGANLVVGARRQEKLDDLVAEIQDGGQKAVALAGDVRDETYAASLVELAVEGYGKLDVAFNNAGTLGQLTDSPNITLDGWQETMDVNLTSAVLAAKYQIPAMLETGEGSLIFTSSFVGYTVGMPGMAPYAASKAGLIGLTKARAAEHGVAGIRVNALLPGGTDTEMSKEFAQSPKELEHVRNLHALKRIAMPDEIAQSALYLASDMASFTTGQALLADGGVSISKG